MFSKNEILRYSRHIRLEEIGEQGQLKLKNAKVLVVGAGGLGCPILQYLTAAGVGTIGILDYDTVDESNLQRQILFSTSDIDKPKAMAARDRLKLLNPNVTLNVHFLKLTKTNALDIFKDYDVIVEGSDNFPTRYLTNDACVILNKPLVYGAVERFSGQLTVFNYKEGPTLRCLCPEPPDPLDIPSCADVGIIGVIPGIIGCMQANEVIKIITETGNPLSGKLLLFDALENNFNLIEIERDANYSKVLELKDYTDYCTSDLNIPKINCEELNAKIQAGNDVFIVDVREADDYDNIKFRHINIPLNELTKNHSLIPKNKEVIVVCRYGVKSISAVNYLIKNHGYKNIASLENGIAEWQVLYGNN